MTKSRKQRQADQLGMPIGTARSKLQRKIIWDLLVRQGENQCARCDDWINSAEDLAITHIEPWLDNDPELFSDHNNVAFMHPTCAEEYASEREAARRQKERDMEIVRVGIINERGEWLPGCFHDGKVYVVGKHGSRYSIHLRNLTGERIEVVLTVDGRDVITGEEGSTKNRGYILHAFETCTIEGWRTSDETVAAFRSGADKDKAYSTQLGTGAHLGVIGVAVFQEYFRPQSSFTILRSCGYSSDSIPVGASAESVKISASTETSGGATYSVSCNNVSDEPMLGFSDESRRASRREREERAQAPLRRRSMRRKRLVEEQEPREEVKLGTKFGEERRSKVGKTTFTRRTTEAAWTLTIEYDTFKNLKRRGIPIKRMQPKKEAPTPSAFPADNEYCKAPPRR